MNSSPKWMIWTGRVLSGLVALGLILSGVVKLVQPGDVPKQFEQLQWDPQIMKAIGVVELASVAVYLIPQTSVLGAILLTGYLGGAVATHVRIHDGFIGPVVFGVIVWLGLFFRDARIRALIPFNRRPTL